jgi:hypothetical protein
MLLLSIVIVFVVVILFQSVVFLYSLYSDLLITHVPVLLCKSYIHRPLREYFKEIHKKMSVIVKKFM